MNRMDLNNYCLNKGYVTTAFPFDDETLIYKVGSKMFVLTNIKSQIFSINLKCDPLMSIDLRQEYEAIKPGYHMNKLHWNTITINESLSDEKIKFLIDLSYDLVYNGLKKSEKIALETKKHEKSVVH